MLKHILIFIGFSYLISVFGQEGADYTPEYKWNKKGFFLKTPPNDRITSKIFSLEIINYSDTVFPNTFIANFSNIEHVVISGKMKYNRFTRTVSNRIYQHLSIDTNKLSTLRKLKSIGIGGFDIQEFPKELLQYKQLERIEINFTFIKDLPEELSQCTSLKSLILVSNSLTDLPASLDRITSLREIILANNNFRDIPDALMYLEGIEKINISNQTRYLYYPVNTHNIDYFKNLEKLKLILEKESLKEIIIEVDSEEELNYIKKNIESRKLVIDLTYDP